VLYLPGVLSGVCSFVTDTLLLPTRAMVLVHASVTVLTTNAGVLYLQELLPRALAPLHACPLRVLHQTGKHVCVLGCEAGGACCIHEAISGRERALCLPCAFAAARGECPRFQGSSSSPSRFC